MTEELAAVKEIASKRGKDRSALISVLQDVHSEYNHLPEGSLEIISRELDAPLASVYGVATFFKSFSFKPRGRHLATVCLGTACHVRESGKVLTEVETRLGVKAGDTTRDRRMTLETVNCLGCCAVGPVMVVDGEYYGEMTPAKVQSVLKRYK
ncbi:MAG: NAD(P)H-dependent oxidoreductase subunit E [Elusimicrobiota bacterium]